jgi:hypothetical protein
MCIWRSLILISLAITFLCKVKEAVPAKDEHVSAFEEFSAVLPAESVREWTAIHSHHFMWSLILWYTAISEHRVRLQLADEDKAELESGRSIILHNNVMPSMLVTQGIELEMQQ